MKRPTERPPPGVAELSDAETPEFLERHRVALLAFLDLSQEASIRMRGRLNMLAALHLRGEDPRALGVAAVDVTQHPHVADALGVRDVPTIVVFVEGNVEDRLQGSVPESVLDEVIVTRMKRA